MSMIDYPNQRIAEAGECDVCGCKMPAGWWVVPLGDGQVACSSSCVCAACSLDDKPGGDLRKQAEDMMSEAWDLREQAADLEWDAEQLVKEADKLDREVSPARRMIPMTGNIHNYRKD